MAWHSRTQSGMTAACREQAVYEESNMDCSLLGLRCSCFVVRDKEIHVRLLAEACADQGPILLHLLTGYLLCVNLP